MRARAFLKKPSKMKRPGGFLRAENIFLISFFYFRNYGLPGCASVAFGSGCPVVLAAMGFAGSVAKRIK